MAFAAASSKMNDMKNGSRGGSRLGGSPSSLIMVVSIAGMIGSSESLIHSGGQGGTVLNQWQTKAVGGGDVRNHKLSRRTTSPGGNYLLGVDTTPGRDGVIVNGGRNDGRNELFSLFKDIVSRGDEEVPEYGNEQQRRPGEIPLVNYHTASRAPGHGIQITPAERAQMEKEKREAAARGGWSPVSDSRAPFNPNNEWIGDASPSRVNGGSSSTPKSGAKGGTPYYSSRTETIRDGPPKRAAKRENKPLDYYGSPETTPKAAVSRDNKPLDFFGTAKASDSPSTYSRGNAGPPKSEAPKRGLGNLLGRNKKEDKPKSEAPRVTSTASTNPPGFNLYGPPSGAAKSEPPRKRFQDAPKATPNDTSYLYAPPNGSATTSNARGRDAPKATPTEAFNLYGPPSGSVKSEAPKKRWGKSEAPKATPTDTTSSLYAPPNGAVKNEAPKKRWGKDNAPKASPKEATPSPAGFNLYGPPSGASVPSTRESTKASAAYGPASVSFKTGDRKEVSGRGGKKDDGFVVSGTIRGQPAPRVANVNTRQATPIRTSTGTKKKRDASWERFSSPSWQRFFGALPSVKLFRSREAAAARQKAGLAISGPQQEMVLQVGDELDRQILGTALPSMINLAVVPLVNSVDTLFVGRLGVALALAGQAAANQAFFSVYFLVAFLPTILAPLVAKSLGSGDTEEAQSRVCEALFLCNILGALGTILLVGAPSMGLSPVLPSKAKAAKFALPYLRLRSLSLIPALISATGFAAYRGLLNTVTPLKVSLATNMLNLVLDPLLIFGAPKLLLKSMGYSGAALATSISEFVSAGVYLRLLHKRGLIPKWSRIVTPPKWERLKPLVAGGTSVLSRQIVLNLGMLLSARRAQLIDPSGVSAAAYGIVNQISSLGIVAHLAIQSTAATLVPAARAQDGDEAARKVADRMFFWGSITGLCLGVGQLIALPFIVPMFSTLPKVRQAVWAPALISSFIHVVNGPVFAGEGCMLGLEKFSDLTRITSLGVLLLTACQATFLGKRLDGILLSTAAWMTFQAAAVFLYHVRFGPLRRQGVKLFSDGKNGLKSKLGRAVKSER